MSLSSSTMSSSGSDSPASSSSSVKVWENLVNSKHLTEPEVQQFYVNWAKSVNYVILDKS